MANDNEKQKADLDKLGRLVDKYAQSRSLPLLISLAMMIFNVVLVLSVVKLVVAYGMRIGQSGALIIVILVFLWIIFSIWVIGKLLARYGSCFYKREGFIKLQRERIPIWVWITFVITFCGPVFLNIFWIMSARWTLTISLTSLGIFMLYAGKKDKKITLGFVYGILSLAEAAATAIGVRIPFINENSCFMPLVIYMVGAGLITTVVVHIYNRKILHKIKQMEPFGEQEKSQLDS